MTRCGDVWNYHKATACRLPLGHAGACDASLPPRGPAAPDLDDDSDDVEEFGRARDEALRREEGLM